jgi:hypothetical protein
MLTRFLIELSSRRYLQETISKRLDFKFKHLIIKVEGLSDGEIRRPEKKSGVFRRR